MGVLHSNIRLNPQHENRVYSRMLNGWGYLTYSQLQESQRLLFWLILISALFGVPLPYPRIGSWSS